MFSDKQDIEKKLAPLFLFGSALLWSFSGLFTKHTAWNGVCLATLRGIIAFVIVVILVRIRKVRIQLNRVKVATAICYFVQGVLFMCANKFTTAANATVLQNMSPLYIILFNALIAKKLPTKKEVLVCVSLFVGIALAFAGNFGGGAALGNILALLSALFYAGVFFLSKQNGSNQLESLLLGNGCYFVLLPFLITNPTVHATSAKEWVFLLVMALLTGIGAWLCFARGIKNTSALQANFITMSEPVMAPIWAFLFLHETVSPLSFVGCAVVVITLLVYNISITRSNAKAELPQSAE